MNYIVLTYVLAFFTLIVSVYANRSEKIVQTVVDKVNTQFNTIMVNNESIVQDQTSLNSSMNPSAAPPKSRIPAAIITRRPEPGKDPKRTE